MLLAFSSVNAQEKKIITQNEIRHFNLPDSLISPKMLAITDMSKAKFLYETNKGKVYALPLDNMPCLVTTIQSNMPVYKNSPKGYIPNALREREIIPDSHKK